MERQHKKHRRLSVQSRNARIITQVNKGATTAELVEEYKVTWGTIRDSIRDKHYNVRANPKNQRLYDAFLATVRANDAAASKASSNEQPTDTLIHADATQDAHQVTVQEYIQSSAQVTNQKHDSVTNSDSNTAASNTASCIYLLDIGYALHVPFADLLAMDNGNALFMVPRFCINEMKKMSENPSCSVKDTAKEVLLKMYSESVWKKRIIPFEPEEQGFVPKTPDIKKYKTRSFGIAEAAMELYINSDCKVHVLTNAMEVQRLVNRMAKAEGLSSEILVTRVYNHK